MRFTTARLCGGKSFMAIPADPLDLDMGAVTSQLESRGIKIEQSDDMMAVFRWKDLDVTLYSQGKVMFFPLEDRALCIKYATELLESLVSR